MDPFYSFLIFIILLAGEAAAGQSELAAYYRLGIPVFIARREIKRGAGPGDSEMGQLASALEVRFKNQPGSPALRFKVLKSDGQGRAEVAFHEAWFAPRSGPRYFPVMHSLAKVDSWSGVVQVTGLVNWYVIFLLVYVAASTAADPGFLFVAALVLFLFGLSYAAQAAVNRAAAEEIRAILSS